MEGAYPPGVTGKMIDMLECSEPERECQNCHYYFHGTCDIADRGLTAEDIEALTDDEYTELVERDPDDSCIDHEFREE